MEVIRQEKAIALFLVTVFIGMSVALGFMGFGTWYNYSYKTRVPAYAHFTNAKYANRISIVVDETKKGMEYYENFSGNTAIFFPTPKTEWDYWRNQINNVLDTLLEAEENTPVGSDAYEESLESGIARLYGGSQDSGEDITTGLVQKFTMLLGAHLYKKNLIFMWTYGLVYVAVIVLTFLSIVIYVES